MYDLLFDFIGFPESALEEYPEFISLIVAGCSVELIAITLYLILWFFLCIFGRSK